MKRYLIYICISLGFLFTGCEKSDEYVASPQENFEALWKILDENYCFFEYKDINWNEVHDRYKTQISDTMRRYAKRAERRAYQFDIHLQYVPLLGLVSRLSG